MVSRYSKALVLCAVLGACTSALAQDLPSPISAKRQLVDCMNRRMSASRTLAYNEAAKQCKQQVKEQRLSASARETPLKPGS
jgi:hypothetical protein